MSVAAKTEDTQINDVIVNDINVSAFHEVVEDVTADPAKGLVEFSVKTRWQGQTRSRTVIDSYTIGGEKVMRHFEIDADEPEELLGTNQEPNPQELLMAAVNACMTVGYVANAAVRGITLDTLSIETKGELDLQGFLGISDKVKPGYDTITQVVRIGGNGTPEQFQEIHEAVMKTSPNYFNMVNPITMNSAIEVA